MKFIGKSSILRMKPKKNIEYPLIRLPKEYRDLIGKEAKIYEISENKFLILVNEDKDESELYNWLYNQLKSSKTKRNLEEKNKEIRSNINSFSDEKIKKISKIQKTCPRRDLNPGHGLERPVCLAIYTTGA